MATKTLDLGNFAYRGNPYIWTTLQDVTSLTNAYGGLPYMVVTDLPGTNYVMDNRGRLTNANLTNGQGVAYNLDDAGNRTSVVTT